MFTTKAYTINSLIKEVSALSTSKVTSVSALASNISPRAGVKSAKIFALNSFLNGNLIAVINGNFSYAALGATAKTRVIRALRNRKNA
jgi:hypothetical protein